MSETDTEPNQTGKSSSWGKAKFLLERRGTVFTPASKKPDLVSLVQDVQRFAYLYGEDLLGTIPGLTKNDTQDLLQISKERQQQQQKEQDNEAKEAADERAANKLVQKLIRKFYNKRTRKLLYEDSEKYTSLSTTRVRQRLCDLMGTDVIRLNDKRYFQKLSKRLQEEYESVMDRQEDARAASEDERLRRLMLEGVIDAPDDYRAVVHGEHHKPHSDKKKKRKIRRHASGHSSTEDGHTHSRASDDEDISKSRREDVVTQVGMMSGSRPTSTQSSRQRRTPDERKQSARKLNKEDKENARKPQTLNDIYVRPPHHDTVLRPTSSSSSHSRKARRIMSAAPRITRWEKESSSSDESDTGSDQKQKPYDTVSLPERQYSRKPSKYSTQEPERVSKLRTEETVAGLYSIAEEIVSPVKTDEPDRRVKVVPKQKKMKATFS